MKSVGFMGLGLMGKPMAQNILKAGYPLTVYNRTRDKTRELEQAGAKVAATPRDAARGADVIITMVSDPPAVREVVLGPEGVVQGARRGALLIDMSTISPADTCSLAAELEKSGIALLDAPVSGSVQGASDGTLAIMVGGERALFTESEPLLRTMGDKIFYTGPQGSGSAMKMVVNLVGAAALIALGECLVLGAKSGLDPKQIIQVLEASAMRSALISLKGPRMLRRDFSPQFPLKLMHKDLGLILATAAREGISLPVTALIKEFYQVACSRNQGDLDYSAILTILEQLNGVTVAGHD